MGVFGLCLKPIRQDLTCGLFTNYSTLAVLSDNRNVLLIGAAEDDFPDYMYPMLQSDRLIFRRIASRRMVSPILRRHEYRRGVAALLLSPCIIIHH